MRPQTIVERLDFVAKRVPGLKFTPPTQLKPGDDQFYGCFMSCDMYYIEIKVDQSHQSVKDVIISHGNSAEGISCPVLRRVLVDQDFETFAKHLTGLHSIYQISTNDKKVKQKAYPALTALETDLTILYEYQRRAAGNCHDLVHRCPIGHMEPRRGGLPVKLTFFITPYDLVDSAQKGFINLNVNTISEKNLGLSATVEIEGSQQHKIQIRPLTMQPNSSLPKYGPHNNQNSEKLPAQFVLVLSQRFPMLNTSISQIINDISSEPATIKDFLSAQMSKSKESIISLIAREELELNKGPFCRPLDGLNKVDSELCDLAKHVYSIILPDQNHTYHISDNYLERPESVYIERIPFTHPTSIPSIIKVLRQQALFNFIIGSCIRRNRNPNNATPVGDENSNKAANVFDVSPVSLNNICVSFEYPSKESLATLELDLRSNLDACCQLYALNKDSVCSNEFATKILQKCWSIPVTLRSVLKKCNERRLALLEDSNKRRERELQELLANNTSTQQGLQTKSNHKNQETLMQTKLNTANDRVIPRDLNSIAEFLSGRANNANASENSGDANSDSSNRSNLLKKFSCKPKVKQSMTTKSQTGNKILSLMLKRQNSSPSVEDPQYRGPLTKKIKTKNPSCESSVSDSMPTTTLTTTKLISPSEVISTPRTIIKQTKQGGNNLNVSLSINCSPNKSQPSVISSSTNSSAQNASALSSCSKFSDPQGGVANVRVKLQANGGTGSLCGVQKPRKSSINAVVERLVGSVTPEQQNLMNQLSSGEANSESTRTADSSKAGPNGAKSKSRPPGGDQFAIKQGSSGGGLKLTVTKTKPSTPIGPSSSTSSSSSSSSSSNNQSTTLNNNPTQAISNATPASTTTGNSSNASSSNTPSSQSSKQTEDNKPNKTADSGSSAPRYTIPKISKTQQASQSSNQSNAISSDKSSSSNSGSTSDPNQQPDDSNNPSSSGNSSSTAPSSTTTKRTTSNPFNRNISSNRNPVSSSTHPPNRTTSNPLANAMGRPSSTNNINNHVINRITSSTSGGVGVGGAVAAVTGGHGQATINMGQPILSRSVNLMPQPFLQSQGQIQPQPQPQALLNQPQPFNVGPRYLGAGLMAPQPTSASLPLLGQPLAPRMFGLHMPQQQNIFASPNDLNLIAASQVALLNQQQQLQQQQKQLEPQQIPNSLPLTQVQNQQSQQQAGSVTSSSDYGEQDGSASSEATVAKADTELAASTSTPSSPTECSQVETVAPPPLIPIDSLHEGTPASPNEDRDDESDRLSIDDMNESTIAGDPN